jgi:hypothetical protein
MAEGTEVGRIYIRVSPDTDEFRRELKAKLEEIERELEGEIPFDGDTTKAEAKAKETAENAPKGTIKYDSQVEKLDPKQVEDATKGFDEELEFKANLDRFRRRYLNKFQKLISDFEVNVPLDFEGEELRKKYQDLEKGFGEKLKLLDPKKDKATLAQLRRDVDEFYQDVRSEGAKDFLLGKFEVDERVQRLGDLEKSQRNIELLMDQLNADLYKAYFASEKVDVLIRASVDQNWLIRQLASLKRTILAGTPKLVVDVDKGRFQRGLLGLTNAAIVAGAAISKAFGAVTSGVGKLASAGLSAVKSFMRLPEWVLLTVAVMSVLAPVLALVSGLLVALPGIIAGIGVPLGVIALGMDGIKKAAETAKPAFEDLKKTISDTFAEDLVPGFEQIRDRLIPGLKLPLQGVAESLSSAFNGIVSTLSSPTGLNNLQVTVDNISAAIQTATPGLKSFTSGLTQLVAELSKGFPGFGEALSNLGAEFAAWVDKVSSNGQLQSAMENLASVLSEIGGLIKDIAGWSFAKLADDGFMNSVKGFVEDLRTIVDFLLPGMAAAFQGIAAIIAPIGDGLRLLAKGRDWLQDKLGIGGDDAAKAGEAAEKAGGDAGKKFQESLTKAAADASANGASLTDAINKQLASGVDVNNDLQEQALRSAFSGTGVTDAVASQIETQMGAVISRAQAAVKTLGPTLQADIDAALLPLQSIPEKLMPSFEGIGAAIGGAWGGITAYIRTATGEMGDIIAQEFMNIPAKLMPAIAGFGAAVGGAVGAIKGFIANAGFADAFGQAFSGAAGKVSAALAGVTGAVASALTPALGVVASTVAAMLASLQGGLAAVVPVVEGSFAAVPAVVAAKMAEANAAVAAGGEQMVSTALGFAGAMESAGLSIGASFAAGIASSASLVSAAAESLVAAARVFFPNSPAKEGPFSGSGWVDKSGEAVGEGFASGMSSSQQEVVATARALMQAVKDIFGSAEGLTLNFNMGPVTQQAEAATASVKSFGDTLAAVPTAPLDDLARVQGTGVSAADSQASRDELSRQLDLLEMERKELELQKGQVGANQAAIKARLEEIRQQKLQLGLQKDQLEYASKYGEQTEESGGKIDQFYRDMGEKIFKMPTDFARSVGSQFMSDLGISGQGAIPQLLEQGSQFIFQVANMDTALSAQQTLQRRQGQARVGR